MREEFYQKVEGKTYAVPQYGHEIKVKIVGDLDQKDSVAMNKEAMEELGIMEGDTVEIYGAWIKEAKAVVSIEDDITFIKMSKAVREALPCDIGQYVGIRKKYVD